MMEYAYYPGCSLEATGKPYDVSLRRVFERLGIGLKEIEDWNCCGATSYISMNKLAAYAISARNLAVAQRMDMPVCAPCSSCYTILSKVNRHVRWSEAAKARLNEALAAAGLHYEGATEVLHPLDIIVNYFGIERVVEKVVRPLHGMKVAPYYGCQIVRPMGRFDDRDEPMALDNLFTAVGGDVVRFRSKVRCCGGMLMTTYEDVALRLNRDILLDALEAGAEVIITTCPMCQINLEAYQDRIEEVYGLQQRIPVIYFTQLLGIALGCTEKEMMLDAMVVDTRPVLRRLEEVPV